MKKAELVELGLIAVLLVLGFRVFITFLDIIVAAIYTLYPSLSEFAGYIWPNIVQLILCILGILLILKFRRQIAQYIIGKKEKNEEVPLKISKKDFLYIIIIAISITSLLASFARIVSYAFDYFKENAGCFRKSATAGSVTIVSFKTAMVKSVLTLILFYFAKPISGYLTKPFAKDQPIIDNENRL